MPTTIANGMITVTSPTGQFLACGPTPAYKKYLKAAIQDIESMARSVGSAHEQQRQGLSHPQR